MTGRMTENENAETLGNEIARCAHTGTDYLVPIKAAQNVLKAARDNPTVRGILREWLERLEHPKWHTHTEGDLRLRLTFEVLYELNGELPLEMALNLEQLVKSGMGEGRVTGAGPAEVVEHDYKVIVLDDSDTQTKLMDRAIELDLKSEDLDDLVHELASRIGSLTNNEGVTGQLRFIHEQLGDEALREVERLREAKE